MPSSRRDSAASEDAADTRASIVPFALFEHAISEIAHEICLGTDPGQASLQNTRGGV